MVKKINSSVVWFFSSSFSTLLYFTVHTFLSVYTEGFRDLKPAHSVDRWNRIANHFWWFLRVFSFSLSSCWASSLTRCALWILALVSRSFGDFLVLIIYRFQSISINEHQQKWQHSKSCSHHASQRLLFIFKQISTRSLTDIQFTMKREQIGNLLEKFSFSNRKPSGHDVSVYPVAWADRLKRAPFKWDVFHWNCFGI